MISQKTIEEVKRKTNLVDLVGESVVLRKQGGNFTGLCPFHAEKTGSFTVREQDGFYYCFGCGASGSAVRFAMETRGLGFPEAIEFLANRAGIIVEYEEGGARPAQKSKDTKRLYELTQAAQRLYGKALQGAPKEVQLYLEKRGLTPELVSQFGLGYAPGQWRFISDELRKSLKAADQDLIDAGLAKKNSRGELYDLQRGRLIFPIMADLKRVAGFGGRVIPGLIQEHDGQDPPKYINSPESEIYKKSDVLYGLPLALQSVKATNRVTIVEGYLDVISMFSQGVTNVVATCGTALTAEHVKRLGRLCKRVNLLFDGDRAGRKAASSVFPLFLNSGLDVQGYFLPSGDDPDTFARRAGGSLSAELESLPQRSAFESFLEGLVLRHGSESVSELGSAALGAVADEAVSWIGRVESPFERDALIDQAALFLRIAPSRLSAGVTVNVGGSPAAAQPTASQRASAGGAPATVPEGGSALSALGRLDRQIVEIAMAGRGTLSQRILTDSDLVDGLHPAVFRFVSELNEILSSEDHYGVVSSSGSGIAGSGPTAGTELLSEQKEAVLQLLKRFGADWVALWRHADKLRQDPEVDLDKSFNQCVLMVRKRRVEKALELLQSQIRYATDLRDKLALGQKVVELSRERQLLSNVG